jgi:ankyrin repeat protein
MQLLLEHGANVNAKDRTQNTPLHLALRSRVSDTVKVFIQHKADVRAP